MGTICRQRSRSCSSKEPQWGSSFQCAAPPVLRCLDWNKALFFQWEAPSKGMTQGQDESDFWLKHMRVDWMVFPGCNSNGSTAGGKTQEANIWEVSLYTEVVTLSLALLTSFLFESSPLAAFISFRKFSTFTFIFFNSPGCGVARLRSVL